MQKTVKNLCSSGITYSFLFRGIGSVWFFCLQLLILLNLMKVAWGNKLLYVNEPKNLSLMLLKTVVNFIFIVYFIFDGKTVLYWNCLGQRCFWQNYQRGFWNPHSSSCLCDLTALCSSQRGNQTVFIFFSWVQRPFVSSLKFIHAIECVRFYLLFKVANIPCRDMDGPGDGHT